MRKLSFFLGILGPVAFIFFSSLAIKLSGFNSDSQAISNVVTTQYGWLQNLAFVAGGLGIVLLGVSMSKSQKNTKVAPFFVIFFGIAFLLQSLFPSNDNQTDVTTLIHIGFFALGTLSIIIATGIFGKALARMNGLIATYSFLTTLVCGIGFIGIFATQGSVGLWQQMTILPLLLWSEVLGIYTFVNSKKLSA